MYVYFCNLKKNGIHGFQRILKCNVCFCFSLCCAVHVMICDVGYHTHENLDTFALVEESGEKSWIIEESACRKGGVKK